MFLAGAIVVGAALITEILFHPPYWVHAALWLPLILVVTLGPLRPMKGLSDRGAIPSPSGGEPVRRRRALIFAAPSMFRPDVSGPAVGCSRGPTAKS